MSLEQIIAANTEAVAAQTNAINTFVALLQKSASTVQSVMASEGTTTSDVLANDKTEVETAKKSTKTKAAAKPEPKEEPKVEEATTTSSRLELADVTPVVVELAKKDRAAAIALLGEFGAKKATELNPFDYKAFLKKANAIISGEDTDAEDDLV